MKKNAQTSTEFIILAVVVSYLIFFVLSLAIDLPDMTNLQTDLQTKQYYASLPLAILDVYSNSTHTELLVKNSFKEPVTIHTVLINEDEFIIDEQIVAGENDFINVNVTYQSDIDLWLNYSLVWSNSKHTISYAQKYPIQE